jgi:hypothetical protein
MAYSAFLRTHIERAGHTVEEFNANPDLTAELPVFKAQLDEVQCSGHPCTCKWHGTMPTQP